MTTVFVLGNAGVDLSLALPHLARPGETAVATSAARCLGGKGLNQAVVAARAGAHVRFCAAIGRDADAASVSTALAGEPMAEVLLHAKPVPTDQSIIMVAADGENSIVSLCGCADALTEAEASAFAGAATSSDIVLLQGNLTERATFAAARASAARVMLNAAPLRWPVRDLLRFCEVVVVNRHEAESITGLSDPEAMARELRSLGCATAVVTLGSDGCLWMDAQGASRQGSVPVMALDTSGAGDTFCGVLAARLGEGAPLRNAIATAQTAAALSVTRHGTFTALPSVAELRDRHTASSERTPTRHRVAGSRQARGRQ